MGLGKSRSKYGRFIDEHRVDQGEVAKESGLNKDTVSKACNEDNPPLRSITKDALAKAAGKLTRKNVRREDFWA